MLLAIDTSTTLTGLACYAEHGLLGECSWYSERNHTAHLLPQLQLLLQHIRRSPADVQAVAVALGPGSWSGLRVGMSVAKGIALAGNLPLFGIGTLEILAYPHRHRALPVYPLLRLGRERFATTRFTHFPTWQRVSEYQNVTLAELCAQIDAPALLCGDIDQEVQEQIQQTVGIQVSLPTSADNLRRPGYLAELAWPRFVTGACDDLARLEPLYLGEPVRPGVRPTSPAR